MSGGKGLVVRALKKKHYTKTDFPFFGYLVRVIAFTQYCALTSLAGTFANQKA